MKNLKVTVNKAKPPVKFKKKSEKTDSGRKLTFKLVIRIPRKKRVKKAIKKFVRSMTGCKR